MAQTQTEMNACKHCSLYLASNNWLDAYLCNYRSMRIHVCQALSLTSNNSFVPPNFIVIFPFNKYLLIGPKFPYMQVLYWNRVSQAYTLCICRKIIHFDSRLNWALFDVQKHLSPLFHQTLLARSLQVETILKMTLDIARIP